MIKFKEVVDAWDSAPVTVIHPLRAIDVNAYWASGVYQAKDAARRVPKGGTIVDFGCGDGRLALPLAGMGLDVIAVDASPAMLKRVEQGAKAKNVKLRTLESDGLDLPNLIEPVDAIVSRAVLIHHDFEGVAALVLAFGRCLKPGGHLIADWPLGAEHERRHWLDVTTWHPAKRIAVANRAGLELVEDATPSVWRKREED